jgi:hypothetical protein
MTAENMATLPIKLFLSYCSTDRAFADKLHSALSTKDRLEIWYDQDRLQLGDSLVFSISDGLNRCDYGIVLLSPAYMDSIWCQREFASMVALERTEKKIILPIWHGVNLQQVTAFSPFLGDTVAIRSDLPLDEIVLAVEAVVWGGQKAREIGDPLQREYSELADALADHDTNERLKHGDRGVTLAANEVSHLLDVFERRIEQVKATMRLQVKRFDHPTVNSLFFPAVLVSGSFRLNLEVGYLNRLYTNDIADNHIVVTVFAWPNDIPPMVAAFTRQRDELQQVIFHPRFSVSNKVQWRDHATARTYTSEEVVTMALTLFKEEIALRLTQS